MMGFTEVARHLSVLRQMEFDILAEIDRWKPEFAILVDYPGLHLRLGEQLRLRGLGSFSLWLQNLGMGRLAGRPTQKKL